MELARADDEYAADCLLELLSGDPGADPFSRRVAAHLLVEWMGNTKLVAKALGVKFPGE